MATITYKCNVCDREIDLLENKQGLTTFAKCVITYGCKGKLLSIHRNPDNIRESFPAEVAGLEDYSPRNVLFNYTQTLPANIWVIDHDLNTAPAVSAYVYNQSNVLTELDPKEYKILTVSSNQLKLVFNGTFTGKAQLVSRNSIKNNPVGIPNSTALTQVTSNGYFVFAIPKYLTKFDYPPTLLPPPGLPYDLHSVPVRIEVSIKKPNEEEEICTEYLTNSLSNTPWNGWNEVLIRKRRNYYLFSKSILAFRTLGGETVKFSDIPDGTQLKITRIDYGTGVLQPLETESLFIMLSNSPYTTNDKIKNLLVDVGDMVDNTIDYFTYKTSDFFVDQSNVDKTYPDIVRVANTAVTPTPSPTVTPTITPTISVTPTLGPIVSPTPMASLTPTPSTTRTPLVSPSPTPSKTPLPSPTGTPSPSITPSHTPAPSNTPVPSNTPAPSSTPAPSPVPQMFLTGPGTNLAANCSGLPNQSCAPTASSSLNATGGVPPYTYHYNLVSGSALNTFGNFNVATSGPLSISWIGPNERIGVGGHTYVSTFQYYVTDSVGQTVYLGNTTTVTYNYNDTT